jgi:hypothetical protein
MFFSMNYVLRNLDLYSFCVLSDKYDGINCRYDAAGMNDDRVRPSAVVVSGLPNVYDYIFEEKDKN